jgi:PAS domain S-box-containing protein
MILNLLQLLPAQRILLPNSPFGWLAWVFLLALCIWLVSRAPDKKKKWERRDWLELGFFALLIPISILLTSLRLPADGLLPIPGLGAPALGPLIPFLAAIPWILAAARLGTLPGAGLAAFSGLLLAIWDTRSPFTPIEYALIGALFGIALSQMYATRLYSWLRQPVVAAALLCVFYPLLYLLTSFFWVSSDYVASLDFAISRLPFVAVSMATQLLVGGAALYFVRARWPALVAAPVEPRRTAPSQRSIEARLLFTLGPLVLLAFIALGALGWWISGRTADQLLSDRMDSSAKVAADSLPFLLETGQNLILQLAGDTRLADASSSEALAILQTHLRSVPYFDQLSLLDTGGNTIAAFPAGDFLATQPNHDEVEAVALAIQGVSLQFFTTPPLDGDATAARLTFIAAVRNDNDQVRAVLVGETSLATNPFAQPIIQSLASINELGGQGLLIDGDRTIAIGTSPAALLQPYNGRVDDAQLIYEDVGADGARRQVHYEPVTGSNWAVVAQWPASLSQQRALAIALPLLGALVVLAVLAYGLLRISLRSVSTSLSDLISETRRIATGDLDAPLSTKGADEIGRLSDAFESMRKTLKARSEENQRLLSVSQGIASNLDVRQHIDPILEAALAGGANSARLVFSSADEGSESFASFGKGKSADVYQSLDAQVLTLTRSQARVLLNNPGRARLKVDKGVQIPEAIAAFALAEGSQRLGALWLAFDAPQTFGAEAVRYLETLAGQAAKAAANTRMFLNARIGRERLEAVFANSSDPILVSDQTGVVLMANPAAQKLFGEEQKALQGARVDEVVHKELLGLYQGRGGKSVEVSANGNNYQANLSLIHNEDGSLGTALILRDVSQFKQAEMVRADFLSTLSHDLHDPLELLTGYVSMLGIAGELNEQQQDYMQKIEHSIENITRLTSSLLDLDRINSGQALQLARFDLADMMRDAIAEVGPRARQKRIDIVLQEPRGTAVPVEGDRTLLQRAFYNLLDNAVKYSTRGEQVEVSSSFAGAEVTVGIGDRGAGIAPVDLPKVFEPPRTGEKSSFGLPIVKSIIERHGGKVWAESELGFGSSFYCQFPVDQTKIGQ